MTRRDQVSKTGDLSCLDKSGTLSASRAAARGDAPAAAGEGDAQESAEYPYLSQAARDWIHTVEHYTQLGTEDPWWDVPDRGTLDARIARLRAIPNSHLTDDITSIVLRGRFKLRGGWKAALDKLYAEYEDTVENPRESQDKRERWYRYSPGSGPTEVTFDRDVAEAWIEEDPTRVRFVPNENSDTTNVHQTIGRIRYAVEGEHGEPLASTWPAQYEVFEDGTEVEVGGLEYWASRHDEGRLVDMWPERKNRRKGGPWFKGDIFAGVALAAGAVFQACMMNGNEWGGRL